nr:hypothetical protein [Bradyrhizobium diazoefficiens]
MIPFLDRLNGATSVLIAGCGSDFDVFAGVPLALFRSVRQCCMAG